MADKTIGDLPAASAIYDDDLFLLEQSGEAKNLRGALYKAYLQGFVDAASAASEEAAAALAGVRDAINNIPEGAATPIVNDLTTGGTSMALSAEMGKVLKSEIDGLTYSDVDAAPAGYGWGERNAGPIDKDIVNTAVATGLYQYAAGYEGRPEHIPYGVIFTQSRFAYELAQIATGVGNGANSPLNGAIAIRTSGDSGTTFTPWEYLNPPMQAGVEYRTTERYMGKPVYTKLVSFGAMPNNTTKSVEYGEASCRAISVTGEQANGITLPGNNFDYPIQLIASDNTVKIKTIRDESNNTASITVRYYKNTD